MYIFISDNKLISLIKYLLIANIDYYLNKLFQILFATYYSITFMTYLIWE